VYAAQLHAAGLTVKDVLFVHVYLSDMALFPACNTVYQSVFGIYVPLPSRLPALHGCVCVCGSQLMCVVGAQVMCPSTNGWWVSCCCRLRELQWGSGSAVTACAEHVTMGATVHWAILSS